MFEDILFAFGKDCYSSPTQLGNIRCDIVRYIKANGDYSNVVRKVVEEAKEFHATQLCENGRCRHGALMLGLSAAQHYNLDEPTLMEEVLMTHYNCEGNFGRMFNILDRTVGKKDIDNVLYPGEKPGYPTPGAFKTLEYFLKVGSGIRVVEPDTTYVDVTTDNAIMRTRAVPMMDVAIGGSNRNTPLYAACCSENAEAILLLLRYGADPIKPIGPSHFLEMRVNYPIKELAVRLNSLVFWRSMNDLQILNERAFARVVAMQDARCDRLVQSLTYFARAMPRLPLVITEKGNSVHREGAYGLHISYKELVPTQRVPELSHFCRLTVRKTLAETHNLPRGIWELPLPGLVQRYLDLSEY